MSGLTKVNAHEFPVPTEKVEQFLGIIKKHIPDFDIDAARKVFEKEDTLYEFPFRALPDNETEDRLSHQIYADFEKAGLTAITGPITGEKDGVRGQRVGFFVAYKNFRPC